MVIRLWMLMLVVAWPIGSCGDDDADDGFDTDAEVDEDPGAGGHDDPTPDNDPDTDASADETPDTDASVDEAPDTDASADEAPDTDASVDETPDTDASVDETPAPEDDPLFDTGVAPDAPLESLNVQEATDLCISLGTAFTQVFADGVTQVSCSAAGAAAGVAPGVAPTPGMVGVPGAFDTQACEEAVDECLALTDAEVGESEFDGLFTGGSPFACDGLATVAGLQGCTATVQTYEDCVNAGLQQAVDTFAAFNCAAWAAGNAAPPAVQPAQVMQPCANLCPGAVQMIPPVPNP